MLTAIAAILVFCVLIFSHELGHFSFAKLFHVHVYSFNLGMGPKLLKWRRKETEYSLRLFPIGGSCQMMGEDEDVEGEGSFNSKKVWQRMLIIFGGPFFNFITAMILFIFLFGFFGTPSQENVVGIVNPDEPAALAGVEPGDRILSVDGIATDTWQSIPLAIAESAPGAEIELLIERNGETLTLTMQPYYSEEHGRYLVGIGQQTVKYGFFQSIGEGVKQSFYFTKALLAALVGMVTGTTPVDVGGPVAVVSVIGQAAQSGLQTLLSITAYLSINLGVINLLPIPALDGSRIVFLAVEGLRGKPLNREREGMVHFIGLMLLFALIIVITYQDIVRLVAN